MVNNILPLAFFLILLILIITEKVNRSIMASFLAILLVFFGTINFEEAVKTIDFNTIGLLVGMMISVSIAAKTGIFQFLAIKMLKISGGRPIRLIIYLCILTAFLSAFLDNVTTVLLITPITIYITKLLKISAFPFIISIIFFSNIGGTATLIGDPPNIIIGSEARLSFNQFLIYNGPIVLINIFLSLLVIFLMFKKKLRHKIIEKNIIKEIKEESLIRDRVLLVKVLFVLFFVLLGFLTHNITHIENSIIALSGAFLILLLTTKEPDHTYKEIEWATIFFFIALFVIVGAIEKTGFLKLISEKLVDLTQGNLELTTMAILFFVGILSGFIDNIPITVVFVEIIKKMSLTLGDVSPLWWALSLGACFGGNMTLIGASANIVAADIYNKNDDNDEKINYSNFLKYGFLINLLSLLTSAIYLKFIFFKTF